jgi:hypothetical protein
MAGYLESSLVRSVMRRLQSTPGVLARKRRGGLPGTVAGDPDVYFTYRGQHVEVELKPPGKHPTPVQQAMLDRWRGAGAVTRVVHSVAELDALLAELEGLDKPLAEVG